MMKTRIIGIGWMTMLLIVGQLANGQESQNLPNTDEYMCVTKATLYKASVIKLRLLPGDVVDAYPSPKGDGWLKIIIEGETYSASGADFISQREIDNMRVTGKAVWINGYKCGLIDPARFQRKQNYSELRAKGKRYSKTKIDFNTLRPTYPRNTRNTQAAVPVSSIGYDSGAETEHWLQENINSGHYLLLEDGTMYEVDAGDRIDCSLWLPISDLVVVDKGYGYLIINKDDEESVHAKKVVR